MRYPVPENKTVFVRFHKQIDDIIEEKAIECNLKPATLVAQILTAYVHHPFPLSPISHSFFVKRGRGREKVIGKGMNITMRKVVWNSIRITGEELGMKENEMRTAIIYSYFETNSNISEEENE